MKHFAQADIETLDKIFRINLINGITGIKPANLIGTISDQGLTNLAIISSVVHLGSNPALIGFVMRPTSDVPRHTYENIIATQSFTINHVKNDIIKAAHYTSAKFSRDQSEFDQCGFEAQFLNNHTAPYVAESLIKIGLQLEEIIDIKSNDTKLIVGVVKHLYLDEGILDKSGQLDLTKAKSVGVSGVNGYYDLNRIAQYPFARISDWKKHA